MEETLSPIVRLEQLIRDVPDFPKPGIMFKDIGPLLADGAALKNMIELLVEPYKNTRIDIVAGIESRGFVLGAAVAYALGTGLIMVRKQGKLPGATIKRDYTLEYNTSTLELQVGAVESGQHVLIVDDVLATGGSAKTAAELIEAEGGHVMGFSFLIELLALEGQKFLNGKPCVSLIQI